MEKHFMLLSLAFSALLLVEPARAAYVDPAVLENGGGSPDNYLFQASATEVLLRVGPSPKGYDFSRLTDALAQARLLRHSSNAPIRITVAEDVYSQETLPLVLDVRDLAVIGSTVLNLDPDTGIPTTTPPTVETRIVPPEPAPPNGTSYFVITTDNVTLTGFSLAAAILDNMDLFPIPETLEIFVDGSRTPSRSLSGFLVSGNYLTNDKAIARAEHKIVGLDPVATLGITVRHASGIIEGNLMYGHHAAIAITEGLETSAPHILVTKNRALKNDNGVHLSGDRMCFEPPTMSDCEIPGTMFVEVADNDLSDNAFRDLGFGFIFGAGLVVFPNSTMAPSTTPSSIFAYIHDNKMTGSNYGFVISPWARFGECAAPGAASFQFEGTFENNVLTGNFRNRAQASVVFWARTINPNLTQFCYRRNSAINIIDLDGELDKCLDYDNPSIDPGGGGVKGGEPLKDRLLLNGRDTVGTHISPRDPSNPCNVE